MTQAGCGAICPAYGRGCYGCFGPMESPNVDVARTLVEGWAWTPQGWVRSLRTFNANAPAFREASTARE